MKFLREDLEIQKNPFVDSILDGLREDLEVFDAIVDWDWNSKDSSLMLRVVPRNSERFEEMKRRVVDLIRDIALKIRFNVKAAIVKVQGDDNMLFKMKPAREESQNRRKQ